MSDTPPLEQAVANGAIADADARSTSLNGNGNGNHRPAAARKPLPIAGDDRGPGREPIDELLHGLRCLGYAYRSNEKSIDGPWRAECPICFSLGAEGDMPLTLTRAGDVRCRRACDPADITDALLSAVHNRNARSLEARIVTLEEFAAVEEAGAAPVIGEPDRILIPEGGDVMFYGDGGAGKTTLTIDLACHLAAGADWLEIPVPRPRRVLLIESEGPRPFFRKKLARKLEAWQGPSLAGRVLVFEQPWATVRFDAEDWRTKLAQLVRDLELDVLIAGPLTRLGMDTGGTLQEVRTFMDLVADVRRQSERPLTVVLVHHESKAGAVSGAWEGAGDSLFHIQAAGNGHTVLHVQKARWDSERHGKTLHLAWADGDNFRLEGDRNYLDEIVELLSDGEWRTDREIAEPKGKGGIGANQKTIRELLEENAERFEPRTGDDAKALGRRANATVWQLRSGVDAVDAVGAFSGGAEEGAALRPSLKGAAPDEHTPSDELFGALDGSAQSAQTDPDEELERVAAKFSDLAEESS